MTVFVELEGESSRSTANRTATLGDARKPIPGELSKGKKKERGHMKFFVFLVDEELVPTYSFRSVLNVPTHDCRVLKPNGL